MPTPVLDTERLRLRPLDPERDAGPLHAAFGDPETLRFWHRLPREGRDATRAMLAEMVGRPGHCEWAVCLAGEDEAIGHVGFGTPDASGRSAFGYILRREHWGRGYASEAARAALAHGFETVGLWGAELWIYEGNHRSIRVAEKLGCTFRGSFFGMNGERRLGVPTRVYGITAQEWGVAKPPRPPVAFYQVQPVIDSTDVGAAIDFWCGKLGFRLEWAKGAPPFAASVTRSHWNMAATVRFARVASAPRERPGVLSFAVGDALALHGELRQRGVAIDAEPEVKPWGLLEFDVVDCHGQRLRFFSPPDVVESL